MLGHARPIYATLCQARQTWTKFTRPELNTKAECVRIFSFGNDYCGKVSLLLVKYSPLKADKMWYFSLCHLLIVKLVLFLC